MPEFSLSKYVPDSPQYCVNILDSGIANTLHIPFESRDILSKVIFDRAIHLYEEITQVNKHLHERETLARNLQSQIDESICNTVNLLLSELNSYVDMNSNTKVSLSKQINDLYQEARRHKLLHWQSTVALTRDLRSTKKMLNSALLDLWMIRFLS